MHDRSPMSGSSDASSSVILGKHIQNLQNFFFSSLKCGERSVEIPQYSVRKHIFRNGFSRMPGLEKCSINVIFIIIIIITSFHLWHLCIDSSCFSNFDPPPKKGKGEFESLIVIFSAFPSLFLPILRVTLSLCPDFVWCTSRTSPSFFQIPHHYCVLNDPLSQFLA